MDDTWEDTTLVLLAKKADAQVDQEVKDSWEDDDDEVPPPEPVPQTSAPKPAKESADKSKSKAKAGQNGSQHIVQERTLTAQELEELQRKSDLQNFKDALGITDDEKCALSSHEPTTKDDFKQFAQFLASEINKHNKKKEYSDFLSDLFRMLCLDLDSEHVRRLSKEISILASEMQKREKESEKQHKQKVSKKPAIVQSKGVLDDIADAGDGFYGDEDDDFM